ncbi:hypothetical protein CDAR_385861 [Caerostris darwini]|uniref:Uncharacterized protein n=1 Tax=Caerostris darwini TaxID=1538125 RepID=A0AAV4QFX3_9ARAC|nr:hypothetical protein CDAR_385861 [Caerostris darwini]
MAKFRLWPCLRELSKIQVPPTNRTATDVAVQPRDAAAGFNFPWDVSPVFLLIQTSNLSNSIVTNTPSFLLVESSKELLLHQSSG